MTTNINRLPILLFTINPSIGGGGPINPNYTLNNQFPELNPPNSTAINQPGNINLGIHIEIGNSRSNYPSMPFTPINLNTGTYALGQNISAINQPVATGDLFQSCLSFQRAQYADSLSLTGKIITDNPNSYCAYSMHALNLFEAKNYLAAFDTTRIMKSLNSSVQVKTPQLNWMKDFFITAASFGSLRVNPYLGSPPALSTVLAYSSCYFENHPIDDMESFACFVNKLPGSEHLITAFSALESNVQMLNQHDKWNEFLTSINLPLDCVDFNNPYSAITASQTHRRTWTPSSSKNYLQILTFNLSSPLSRACNLFHYDNSLFEQWTHNIVQAYASFSLFSHANSALADEFKKLMAGGNDEFDLERMIAEAEIDDSEPFSKDIVDVDEIAATVKLGLFGLLGKIFLPDEKSSSFDLGKEEPENCFVVLMNGIFNYKKNVVNTGEMLSKELNNKNIHIIHNASSAGVDLLEAGLNLKGVLTAPNEILHKKVKELREKDPNRQILLINLSQAAAIANNQLKYFPDDWKANMHICTLGGADWIHKDACKSVANYINANDPISGLCNAKKMEHLEKYNVTILPAENGGHCITSKNYINAIIKEFNEANKNEN